MWSYPSRSVHPHPAQSRCIHQGSSHSLYSVWSCPLRSVTPTLLNVVIYIATWSPPPCSVPSYTLLLGHPHPAQSHHIHRYLVTPTLLSPIICIDLSPTLPTGGCSISIDPLSRYPFQSLPYPTYIHVRQAQPCLTCLIYLGPITVSSIYVRCFVSRLTICYG